MLRLLRFGAKCWECFRTRQQITQVIALVEPACDQLERLEIPVFTEGDAHLAPTEHVELEIDNVEFLQIDVLLELHAQAVLNTFVCPLAPRQTRVLRHVSWLLAVFVF